jgi:hypothetical protein
VTIGWDTPDELRVLSRVRFGVRMTGETTNGIAFGATIRADNSSTASPAPPARPSSRASTAR